jgi:hypothetical protein
MHKPNRFLQCILKFLLLAGLSSVDGVAIAQNTPAAEVATSSAASSAAAEKPLYLDSVERNNALLAKAFTAIAKTDELQWLEPPGEKVLALYKAGETRKTKGILLIMHAPEIPQLWPANLENIRRNLPLNSWSTMALPLPAKYPNNIPEREVAFAASTAAGSAEATSSAPSVPTANTATNSSAPSKILVARDKLISGRVDAAIDQINSLGKLEVAVLVDNSSAPDALATLYSKFNIAGDSPLKALILVNLQDQEPLTKAQLAAIFGATKLRVMDVFFNPDSKVQSELRRLHQAEAMRQNVKDYQQLILPSQPSVAIDDTQSFWLGKVYGLLARKPDESRSSKASKDINDDRINAQDSVIK